MKSKNVSFKTDEGTYEMLSEIANQEVRSVSQQIVYFIKEGIARWKAEQQACGRDLPVR